MASQHTLQVHQERTFCSGALSVTSTFRLLVTGNTELKHLERLIRLLTIQKQILEEDETAEPSAIPDELQPFVWWLQ
ncbi:MAG: hypothetical protein R3D69_02840 [Xanthobacteraceae bacterium]